MTGKSVIVVGGGNSALCAALAARENGARVRVLEKAPSHLRGGNTAYTAGSMRVAYEGVDDLVGLMPDLSAAEIAQSDFGQYPESAFLADLGRVTEYRCDPDLASTLVGSSYETLRWMTSHGVRFVPIFGRQAYQIDGRFKFWGGLTIEAAGGGPGLLEALYAATKRAGIDVEFDAQVIDLIVEDGRVGGVVVRQGGVQQSLRCDSVILACGGFESNPEWRARYLGPNWDLAKVRGTYFNTGDGLRMALGIGASPTGHWSGCHAVGWDRNAPEFGVPEIGDQFEKHSYPLSIMVNARGERFVDEGADFRNFTYAKYGREILAQPGMFAWQVFDSKVLSLLRPEYHIRQVTKVSADSLVALAERMDGVDPAGFIETVKHYNAAILDEVPFDPNAKDGRRTTGLAVNKSNWANTLDAPPYEAYAVTCGVTFTFGGLRIDSNAQVLDVNLQPLPGLYAAGVIVGGLFHFNYPGGSGLTYGSVFGRVAGTSAAR